MKRKILAFLLMVSMLLQYTLSVAAAEIIIEEPSDVIVEDPTPDVAENSVEEIPTYTSDKPEENVGMTMADDLLWFTSANDQYWDGIDWSDVYWSFLNGSPPPPLPADWSDKVKWSDVNWTQIRWYGYATPECKKFWKEINWSEVDWKKINWAEVDWAVLKDLIAAKVINISFAYNDVTEGKLVTPVSNDKTIMSSCVTINLKGSGAPEDAYYKVETNKYILIVSKYQDYYQLTEIRNSAQPNGLFNSSKDFFTLASPLTIVNGTPKHPLTKDDYWDITIDDSNCTFAESTSPLPEVTIKSKNGAVELVKNTDYQIEDITESGASQCGVHKLKIKAVPTSAKVAEGEISKDFTVRYADIADFYTLGGFPSEITMKDEVPLLKEDSNRSPLPKDKLNGYIYLEPKNNENLEKGLLPSVTENKYSVELFSSGDFLNVEYSYESMASAEGPVWSDTFSWDDWHAKRTSNILRVKVSVNESEEKKYPQNKPGEIKDRYLKGSIYASIRIIPYSLTEYQADNPKTKPTRGNIWYLAAVNPIPQEYNIPLLSDKYESIGETPIQSVTYSGEEQRPNVNVLLYQCWDNDLFGTTYVYSDYTENDFSQITSYEDNINAGTGKVKISFDGVFSGSITRDFEIKKKDILHTSITIQAQDFLHDGKPHAPVLSISDSQANTVLREDTDYTVTPSSDMTSPGTVTATINGKGNYEGTRSVQYKIIPTSTIVVGTKLEQVADIPDKIDDQKYTGQPVKPEVVITGKNSSFEFNVNNLRKYI